MVGACAVLYAGFSCKSEVEKATYLKNVGFQFDSAICYSKDHKRLYAFDSSFPYVVESELLIFTNYNFLLRNVTYSKFITDTPRTRTMIMPYKIEGETLYLINSKNMVHKEKITFNYDSSRMILEVPQRDRNEIDKSYFTNTSRK